MDFKFCPECGFKFDREYKFCPECGYALGKKAESREPLFEFSADTSIYDQMDNAREIEDLRAEVERKLREEEAARIAKSEAAKKAREEAKLKAEEEATRKAKEEAERKAKEEAERKAKEEEARRKAQQEAARRANEEAKRKAQEAAERKARYEAEVKARELESMISRVKWFKVALNKAKPFGKVDFGKYIPAHLNKKDTKIRDIEWYVVKKEKGLAMLLAVGILDVIPHTFTDENDRKWSNSSLREFLNNYFYENAFNEKEKELIVPTKLNSVYGNGLTETITDKVFLIDSVEKTFPLFRRKALGRCYGYPRMPLEYGVFQKHKSYRYWLRGVGPNGSGRFGVGGKTREGAWSDEGKYLFAGLRPTIWVRYK